jgi:HD-GYP domain-containing protein (c-di-GMP phosphodiesterase class II)
VFAALISDRPYRKAFDIETAMELMIEDNKSFDMKIFLEFMKVFHSEGIEQVTHYADEMNERKRLEAEQNS